MAGGDNRLIKIIRYEIHYLLLNLKISYSQATMHTFNLGVAAVIR